MQSTPQPRTRRADRYRQESGVAPSSALMTRTAPLQEAPPPAMARPRMEPRRVKASAYRRPAYRMPAWMFSAIAGMLVLLLVLFTAQSLMNAYLVQRQNERDEAYARVLTNHPLPDPYRAWIEKYAAENNLRPAFVAAIIMKESSYRPDAESSIGARGLMQLMPDTAEWIAGKLDVTDYSFARMYDPETNIRFGAWYLGYLSRLFRGDPVLVACAYHAGQTTVTKWLDNPAYSRDGVTIRIDDLKDGPTKTYAGRVTQSYGIYEALYFSPAPADSAAHSAVPADSVFADR